MGNKSVHLLLGILILVALPGQTDADAERNVADTLLPDLLVQLGVDADVAGLHQSSGELLDLLDCARGTLLESASDFWVRHGTKERRS